MGAPLPPPPPPSPLTAPSGYTAGWSRRPAPTFGLRKATTVLFWCTAGAMAVTSIAAGNRLAVWNGFRAGSQDRVDVDEADTLVGLAAGLQLLLTLASAIVLSIWSLRSVRDAHVWREGSPRPGLACGGWYIPLGMFVVPFVQFRKVLRSRRQATTALNWWQGLFIAAGVFWVAFHGGDPERAGSIDGIPNYLGVQAGAAALVAVLLVVATVAATRAMRDLDRV